MRNYASIYNFATFSYKNHTFCYNFTQKILHKPQNQSHNKHISTHTSIATGNTSCATPPPREIKSS